MDEKTAKIIKGKMEGISPIYDNVSTESWAQGIRQIKVNELRDKLRSHEESWIKFCEMTSDAFRKETEPDYLNIVNNLKEKIKILETK